MPRSDSHLGGGPVSNETALIFRCCRAGANGQADDRLRELVSGPLHWLEVLQRAGAHQIVPLLRQNLEQSCSDLVPTTIRRILDKHTERNAEMARRGWAELRAVLGILDNAGIPAIPIKGPVLAWQLHGDFNLRSWQDLDFLVHAKDRAGVVEVLHDQGYDDRLLHELTPGQLRAAMRLFGEFTLVGPARLLIEPHWEFAPRTMSVDLDYEAVWNRAVRVEVEGTPLSVLAPEDLFLSLAVHGGKEAWSHLKWVADIDAFVDAFPETDWSAVIDRAAASGTLRMVVLAALVAHRVCGTPIPPPVEPLVAGDATAHGLAERVQNRAVNGDATTFPMTSVSGFRLRLRERLRDRVAYVTRTLLTPRPNHYRMLRLPDRLISLYVIPKVVHDYLLLPAWLVAKRLTPRDS